MSALSELKRAATKRSLDVIDRGNGHYQIVGGPLLVNYYPESKRRAAYVAGTMAGRSHITPAQAVAMALEPPPMTSEPDSRPKNQRAKRARMIRRNGPKCHWCPKTLTLDDSTIDHVIPLARGGLDNDNNRVLACAPCNSKRGHAMPEIKT